MTHYCKMNSDNSIDSYTDNSEIAQQEGFNVEIEADIVRGYDGRFYIDGQQPTPPPKPYSELRAEAYPAISDQLDMLYWDKVNGTNLWQDKIAEIKAKYPKE